MTMKIIDPTLDLDFGPLQFEPPHDHGLLSDGVFIVTFGDSMVAELTRLPVDESVRVAAVSEPGDPRPNAAWRLELTDDEGRVTGSHVLCTSLRAGSRSCELSHEVAVWAALTLMWAQSSRAQHCG